MGRTTHRARVSTGVVEISKVSCRESLRPVRFLPSVLYYVDKRLRLDIAEKQDRPKETPIVVANDPEYGATLDYVFY